MAGKPVVSSIGWLFPPWAHAGKLIARSNAVATVSWQAERGSMVRHPCLIDGGGCILAEMLGPIQPSDSVLSSDLPAAEFSKWA